MSGGSYEYLCWKQPRELLAKQDAVQQMADRLAGLGYARDAAKETQAFLLTLRQFENRIEAMQDRLSDVWHAVEWWDSGDSGEDGVRAALAKYRGEQADG
jgi:hypothetical protein